MIAFIKPTCQTDRQDVENGELYGIATEQIRASDNHGQGYPVPGFHMELV
jgi:hypothetical protein